MATDSTPSDSTARVRLAFSGHSQNVRLDEVIFSNHHGQRRTFWGKNPQEPRTFGWSRAVKSMSLLIVQAAKHAVSSDASRPILSGGRDSPARSLDNAISRKHGLRWLSDMFGLLGKDDTVAKTLFVRQNSNLTDDSRPVEVSVNPLFLPYSNISILRDGREVSGEAALGHLEEDLLLLLIRIDQPTASLPVEEVAPPVPSFHARYRELWQGSLEMREKIFRTRQLIANAGAPPVLNLLQFMRVKVTSAHIAEFEAEFLICNCQEVPLYKRLHYYWFSELSNPFDIKASGSETIEMVHDDPNVKRWFVEFNPPVQPGELRLYRFSFRCSNAFMKAFWDTNITAVTNRVIFHLTQETERATSNPGIERFSDTGYQPIEDLGAMVHCWERGIALNWSCDFPQPGTIRTRWKIV